MHEIAETATIALSIFVLPAASLPKVCDGREFGVQWATCIPPLIAVIYSCLCLRFPFVTGIYIADQMVANVVTDM